MIAPDSAETRAEESDDLSFVLVGALAELCSGSEAGSYLRLIDSGITQLNLLAQARGVGEVGGGGALGDPAHHAPARQLRREPRSQHDAHPQGLIRNSALLGPYRRILHRALWWVLGGGAVSYERGTPAD